MKLTITLLVALGYATLLFAKAAQPPAQQPAQPTTTPTPAASPQPAPTCPCQCPTPAATQTANATASPTATASPATMSSPATTASPTTTASPNAQASPMQTGQPNAPLAKAPCEDKVQASGIPLCSRVQPKNVVLSKDAVQPASNPAKPDNFTHEAHATLKYSPDGTKVIGCAECHHTDQPASALTGVLKTSYRGVMLTSAVLAMPAEKPVYSCRACHAQVNKPPAQGNMKPEICDATLGGGVSYFFCPDVPTVKYPGDDDPTILTNDNAYHNNCITCHTNAIAARNKPGAVPFINASQRPPDKCAGCHKGV
jgi:hypothetical protein